MFEPIKIVGMIEDEVSTPRGDGTPGGDLYRIPFQLSGQPPREWCERFLRAWKHPQAFTLMHRASIARVEGDRIVLDGTTIQEVEIAHRDTLLLCVQQANEEYVVALEQTDLAESRRASAEHARITRHRQEVTDTAKRISFE